MPIHTEDLEYHRPAGIPLLARFYRPEGQAPFPAVLEVHGGAWTSGDRFNNGSAAATKLRTSSTRLFSLMSTT